MKREINETLAIRKQEKNSEKELYFQTPQNFSGDCCQLPHYKTSNITAKGESNFSSFQTGK